MPNTTPDTRTVSPHGDPDFPWHVYVNGEWHDSARTVEGMVLLGAELRAAGLWGRVEYRHAAPTQAATIQQSREG